MITYPDIVHDFTLLNPPSAELPDGSIADLFRERYNPPFKQGYDPMTLTSVKAQCVHITYDGFDTVRCLANADPHSSNGWLCPDHNYQVDMEFIVAMQGRVKLRDKDKEIVKNIIQTEAIAIKRGHREDVRLTTKGLLISYLNEVNHGNGA